jgi:hypothetical protein
MIRFLTVVQLLASSGVNHDREFEFYGCPLRGVVIDYEHEQHCRDNSQAYVVRFSCRGETTIRMRVCESDLKVIGNR